MVQVPTFPWKLLPPQVRGRSFAVVEDQKCWDEGRVAWVKGRPGENNGDKKLIALADYAFPLLPPMPV